MGTLRPLAGTTWRERSPPAAGKLQALGLIPPKPGESLPIQYLCASIEIIPGVEKSNFVDQIRVFCRSGHGGAGSKHFMQTKYTAMAGPDGGDGGRGAHIILRGNSQLWTLLHLRYFKNVLAEDGGNGAGNNSSGKNGKD